MAVREKKKVPASVSIEDFARTPAAHLKKLRASGRTLLTHNGKPSAVVLSPVAYERMQHEIAEAELRKSLDRSFKHIERGEGIPATEAFRKLRDGLPKAAKRPQ